MLHHNFLTCAKAQILDLTVCIVVNGDKKFKSHVDRTMPTVNSSELFSYTQYVQVSSGLNHYFLNYRVHTQTHVRARTHTHTHTHTDGHEYSIVTVDKPQLQLCLLFQNVFPGTCPNYLSNSCLSTKVCVVIFW